jgi:hypothetical protein
MSQDGGSNDQGRIGRKSVNAKYAAVCKTCKRITGDTDFIENKTVTCNVYVSIATSKKSISTKTRKIC